MQVVTDIRNAGGGPGQNGQNGQSGPSATDAPGALPGPRPRRVAVISFHTSPLSQPGVGDAGGLNVYVLNTARALAATGVEVEIFTRATSTTQEPVVQIGEGVRLHHIIAGPLESLGRAELPVQMAPFIAEVLRSVAAAGARFDVVHSHYWLSGQAAAVLAQVWDVPLIHTAHTLAAVKNTFLAEGDEPEPDYRRLGEQYVVDNTDRTVVNTERERDDLVRFYDAPPGRVDVIIPGADLACYSPGDPRGTEHARRRLGLPHGAKVIAFVGRIQPLKAPDVLVRAFAALVKDSLDDAGVAEPAQPGAGQLVRSHITPYRLVIVGGYSGNGIGAMDLRALARELGVAHLVTFLSPRPPQDLVEVYRAADVVAVPSYSESFGLVALEAQACGTPVVAANVGGLSIAVADGETGVLIDGHDPAEWGRELRALLDADARRIAMSLRAPERARGFCWTSTAANLVHTYSAAMAEHAERQSGRTATAGAAEDAVAATAGTGSNEGPDATVDSGAVAPAKEER